MFEELYAQVEAGNYANYKQFLFGIPNVTRDHEGYVYWRGKSVEHYSHQNRDDMKRDAQALADRCLALEAKGFPVNGRTAIEPSIQEAPADTPWLEVLLRFYTFFENATRKVAILYKHDGNVVVMENGQATQQLDSAYDAFHFVQNQGLKALCPITGYEQVRSFMEASKVTPEAVHAALA
jgi:hypothetical protein